jgi:CRISPR-associated protein Csa3
MRTYVSPIGYNSTSVTRPVLSRGVDTGDTVVLVRPDIDDDSRAEEAIGDVERMLTEIEPDVSLTTERITHEAFDTAILECSDIIRAVDDECIMNLGGGARDVVLPVACAAFVHAPLVDSALFFSDIDGTVRELEIPHLTVPLPETVRTTLNAIANADDDISIPELTEATGQSKSTVTRHVAQLAQDDTVDTWKEGKTKHVTLTLTGELALRTDH